MCLWLGEKRRKPWSFKKGTFLFPDSAPGKPESWKGCETLESQACARRGYCKNGMRYAAKVAVLGMAGMCPLFLGNVTTFCNKAGMTFQLDGEKHELSSFSKGREKIS